MASMQQKPEDYKVYDHLIGDIHLWPLSKFVIQRKAFLNKLNSDVFEQFKLQGVNEVDQAIAKTMHQEKQRVKTNPWKADPPNEIQYYRKIQNEYNANQLLADKHKGNLETLGRLINRFSQEIICHFNPKTFLLVRKWSDFIFHTLLYSFKWSDIFRIKKLREENRSAIRINGYTSELRNLFNDHIVVLVPTHSSNLDSICIGYSIDLSLGLPAFSYGAGLNLFDSEFFAFFMNRLGAYKVDRRKKNPIYLQTLTAYSKLSVFEGVNTIFFPGGTRSRSGEVESKLKLGLLGSLIQAQRMLLEANSPQKIVVVPVVLTYESVLEARSLMLQHLSVSGQERFTARAKKPGFGAYYKFLFRVLKSQSQIYLTFGKPMDVFGNQLDDQANSLDHKSHVVHLKDYFSTKGKFIKDDQREMIYTRELGEKIAEAYKIYNYVLPAHLVAYAAFLLLSKMNPQHDIYSLVQLPEEEYFFPEKSLADICAQLQLILIQRSEEDKIIYPKEIEGNVSILIAKGIKHLGVYHLKRILAQDNYGRYYSEDFIGLLYYANRLQNIELQNEIDWSSVQWESDRF
ncbi:MAG: 1-acyl-sn-glycerol-3-phosphate acyltransferase [Saprospiraceae bacterium]|nr:1-acyl-sn-glycerol-3-phosphate acyltransferase [Saprospiraceae bacterium]